MHLLPRFCRLIRPGPKTGPKTFPEAEVEFMLNLLVSHFGLSFCHSRDLNTPIRLSTFRLFRRLDVDAEIGEDLSNLNYHA